MLPWASRILWSNLLMIQITQQGFQQKKNLINAINDKMDKGNVEIDKHGTFRQFQVMWCCQAQLTTSCPKHMSWPGQSLEKQNNDKLWISEPINSTCNNENNRTFSKLGLNIRNQVTFITVTHFTFLPYILHIVPHIEQKKIELLLPSHQERLSGKKYSKCGKNQSSFRLDMRYRKFESFLKMSSFFPLVWRWITLQ